jgi:two-component system LytT family sensor kinase
MKTIPSHLFNRTQKRAVLLHVCCWSAFMLYELAFLYHTQLKFASGSVFVFFSYYAINISLFYSHLHLLDTTFHQKGSYLKGVFLFLIQFLLFMLIKASLDILLGPPVRSLDGMIETTKTYAFLNAFRGVYFCVFATFYWVAGNIAGYRKQTALAENNELIAQKDKAELEQRLSETRNAYLQQQLNPHLLFNSLSFIYSSVYAHSEEASRCVLLLSEIMRFSLDSNGGDGKTLLAAELEQIGNLIEINRYRFEEELTLKIRIESGHQEFRIIPLVLFTLTENLFKHGSLTDPAHPAILEITADTEGVLTFYSHNRKATRSKTARRSGLGLQNTRIRLDHSYPGLYRLEIKEDEHFFELKLTLPL